MPLIKVPSVHQASKPDDSINNVQSVLDGMLKKHDDV